MEKFRFLISSELQDTVLINGRIRYPWSSLLKLLGWHESIVLDTQSIRSAEYFVNHCSALNGLFRLELELEPTVEKLTKQEIGFDSKGWIGSQEMRLNRLAENCELLGLNGSENLVQELKNETGLTYRSLKIGKFSEEHNRLAQQILHDFEYNKRFIAPFRGLNQISGSYKSFASLSGRMSASKKPLMSLPKDMYPYLHAKQGFKLVSIDLKNFELRVLAALIHNNKLRTMINDSDPYEILGDYLFEEYDPKVRRNVAKKTLISALYGAQDATLLNQAKRMLSDEYYQSPRGNLDKDIFEFFELNEIKNFANEQVRWTLWGKIPLFADLLKNQLMNLPIQGTGAIFLKKILIKSQIKNFDVVIPRHDEIIISVADVKTNEEIEKDFKEIFDEVVNELLPLYCKKNSFEIKELKNGI